jgi:hypothetical protein
LFAEVEFLRIRQATGLDQLAAQAAATKKNKQPQRGAGRTAQAPSSDVPPEHWTTNMDGNPVRSTPVPTVDVMVGEE